MAGPGLVDPEGSWSLPLQETEVLYIGRETRVMVPLSLPPEFSKVNELVVNVSIVPW